MRAREGFGLLKATLPCDVVVAVDRVEVPPGHTDMVDHIICFTSSPPLIA
jgi:hypothetical protein